MSTFQNVLSAFAAIVAAFLVILSPMNNSKVTGMGALPALLLSWQCWVLAAFFFGLFFAASRIGNKILKGLLFWTPITAISIFGLSYLALISYVLLQSRHG